MVIVVKTWRTTCTHRTATAVAATLLVIQLMAVLGIPVDQPRWLHLMVSSGSI